MHVVSIYFLFSSSSEAFALEITRKCILATESRCESWTALSHLKGWCFIQRSLFTMSTPFQKLNKTVNIRKELNYKHKSSKQRPLAQSRTSPSTVSGASSDTYLTLTLSHTLHAFVSWVLIVFILDQSISFISMRLLLTSIWQ